MPTSASVSIPNDPATVFEQGWVEQTRAAIEADDVPRLMLIMDERSAHGFGAAQGAMQYATQWERVACIHALLSREHLENDRRKALGWALAENGSLDCVKALFVGGTPDNLHEIQRIFLRKATQEGRLDCVLWLLEEAGERLAQHAKNKDVKDPTGDSQQSTGRPPLLVAVEHGRVDCARALLPYSDSDACDHEGYTALMRAAQRGHAELVALLIPCSTFTAHVRACVLTLAVGPMRAFKRTPPVGERDECVRLLLAVDASLARESDPNGETALHRAADNGQIESLRALLPHSERDALDADGHNAFFIAAQCDQLDALRLLWKDSAPLATDALGLTPLMLAVQYGAFECAQYLLPFSSPQALDHEGKTALMHAAERATLSCVELLLPVSDVLARCKRGLRASQRIGECLPMRRDETIDRSAKVPALLQAAEERAQLAQAIDAQRPGEDRGRAAGSGKRRL